MTSVVTGAALAGAASVLYNAGVALQAVDARRAPGEAGLRLSLAAFLVRRPRWLVGTALGLLGWPLQVAALRFAPLSVVQPALACGLVLLLVLGARALHEAVGRREIAGVVAIIAGVTWLAVVAPEAAPHRGSPAVLGVALGGLGALALAPYARRGRRGGGAVAAALSAGTAFAWSGLSTKLVADAAGAQAVVVAVAWTLATAIASGLAVVGEMSALQLRPASRVAPVVFAVQVAVPVLAAPLLTGERWGHAPLGAAGILAGLAVVLAGALLLMTAKAVRSFVDENSDDSGTSASPPERSEATVARSGPGAPPAVSTTMSPATGAVRPAIADGSTINAPATGDASTLRPRRYWPRPRPDAGAR